MYYIDNNGTKHYVADNKEDIKYIDTAIEAQYIILPEEEGFEKERNIIEDFFDEEV